jgi:glycosyltransferase involved in cell wall biosynthesis
MEEKESIPDYIFETSWEVCNKIGGIYTVLSTGAKALQEQNKDKNIYIGPDFGNKDNPLFKENKTLFKDWRKQASEREHLHVRIGRWEIPGKPIVFLVDFKPFMSLKNEFFFQMWEKFEVDSLCAYGDYEESVMFGYTAGKTIESFCSFFHLPEEKMVAQFHEWTTASGLLYLKINAPKISTLFTTHATTVGRSICFNNKPLYDHFENYNGDQMARELNVTAKHSIEKRGAENADCFTTVSELTAKECAQLLEKKPDIVTPNGFEGDFVPKGKKYMEQHCESRATLKKVAETLLGYTLGNNALFIGTSGRYEYKNKGIDVFLESLKKLDINAALEKEVVAFIMVPGCISGPRKDLQEKLNNPDANVQLVYNNVTHDLYNYCNDEIISALQHFNLNNRKENKVKVILVPSYLDGNDGIFNYSYYDLLIGLDMTVFPSYYEPWGYTPLESAAFGIPTITTDLSGFGLWVSHEPKDIENGVAVILRTEYNYHDVAEDIHDNVILFANKTQEEVAEIRKRAQDIAHKTSWHEFISYYMEAFNIALKNKK